MPRPTTDQIHVLGVVLPAAPGVGHVSTELDAFCTAFRANTTELKPNAVIELPDKLFLLGDELFGRSIYVRPCYPRLLRMCLSLVHQRETRHVVILGSPGIGKTFFGYFLLLHLVQTGATVVCERGARQCRYLLSSTGIQRGSLSDFDAYLDSPSTYYIVDTNTPVDAAAKTILLSSPCRDTWCRFSDGNCAIRYMPVWSREEIHKCREVLFPRVAREDADALFDKWGGVARFVLEKAYQEDQQKKLQWAINSASLKDIAEFIGGGSEACEEGTVEPVVHIHVDDEDGAFMTPHYRFASDFVVDSECEHLCATTSRAKLLNFISGSHGLQEVVGVLRDRIRERLKTKFEQAHRDQPPSRKATRSNMGERKVLNKYFPPDFDPSLVPRRKRPKNEQIEVRMMLPFSIQCSTCGEYMYRGKKFNSRKEEVVEETYHGIRIFRFYIKCITCSSEITFKTDPKRGDYVAEHGCVRNFEPWRENEDEEEAAHQKREEEEKGDSMKALENRTLDSKREMDILDALDEIKAINQRHAKIDTDVLLQQHADAQPGAAQKKEELEKQLEDDMRQAKLVFQQKKRAIGEVDSAADVGAAGTGDAVKKAAVEKKEPLLAAAFGGGGANGDTTTNGEKVPTPKIAVVVKKKGDATKKIVKKKKAAPKAALTSLVAQYSDSD